MINTYVVPALASDSCYQVIKEAPGAAMPSLEVKQILPRLPEKANLATQVFSVFIQAAIAPNDIYIVPSMIIRRGKDRRSAEIERKRILHSSQPRFETFNEFERDFEYQLANHGADWLDRSMRDWMPEAIELGIYGSAIAGPSRIVKLQVLQRHLEVRMKEPFRTLALKALESMVDSARVTAWFKEIRHEVLENLFRDGLARKYTLISPSLMEFYLDAVLAKHAAAHGFSVTKKGMPWSQLTFNSLGFYFTLGTGRIFDDWTGAALTATSNSAAHQVRGHTFALAYLADTVPDVVRLIKHIGRTGDKDGVWQYMFDNTNSVNSPLWGGHWVDSSKPYFGIRY
jgi:hypothetical protein